MDVLSIEDGLAAEIITFDNEVSTGSGSPGKLRPADLPSRAGWEAHRRHDQP